MLKKCIFKCLFLFIVLAILCTNIYYATAVTVTAEKLQESLQEFVSSDANEENYKITVSNNVINVTVDDENYTLNYDLTNKPTFSLEIPIKKGMSYEEYENKTGNLVLPMLGYVATANIQGVEVEDASAYFLFSYLGSALNGPFTTENSYIIFDDLNVSEGVTIEKKDDPKTIYASEFGDRVIEYVNAVYKDKQSLSDSTGINSFLWTFEKIDTTETSCKLVSKLSVNLDADFSNIIGYADKLGDSFIKNDITKENADLVVMLKEGQKCKFESGKEITGYEFYGSDCIEINDDNTEITATSIGTRNGYLYVGEVKKSIYITVEENPNNASLETIKLKIDSVQPDINPGEGKDNTQTQVQNKIELDTLPKTGEEINGFLIVLYIIVGICTIGLLTLLLTKRNKK